MLVDFWATWCGPCKLVLPSVEWIEQEYGDHLKVVKVEADPNPGLMEKYKVPPRHSLAQRTVCQHMPAAHSEAGCHSSGSCLSPVCPASVNVLFRNELGIWRSG